MRSALRVRCSPHRIDPGRFQCGGMLVSGFGHVGSLRAVPEENGPPRSIRALLTFLSYLNIITDNCAVDADKGGGKLIVLCADMSFTVASYKEEGAK